MDTAMEFRLLLLGGRARRSVAGRRDGSSGSRKSFQLVNAASQVREKPLANGHVQAGGGGEVTRHFGGAVRESSAEFVLGVAGRSGR